jgi:small subunit ribosomal protein S1
MILTGLVVDVTDDIVIVNVGLKSEAVIDIGQFKNERGEIEVKPGDEVEVALDAVEDGNGETRLSREKAKRARTWTRLEDAFGKGEIVIGIITGRVKGGFTVEIEHVRAFLPGSLVDVRPVRDTSYLENKPLEFKVIKLDQKRNNVVVSRRAVVEQEFSAERSALMDNLQEGAVVQGHGQEPHRLRCVRRPRWHRWPAAHHRHGLEARQASVGSGQGRRRDRSAHPEVRPRALARFARPQAAGRRSLGEHRPPLSAQHPRVRQGHEHRRLRRVRRDRGRRRGPGARLRDGLDQQERQPGQGRADRSGSRSHGPGRRRGAPPHQPRPQAVRRNPWKEFAENYNRGDKVVGPDQVDHRLRHLHRPRRATSTASCTSRTSPGTSRAKKPCATYQKGQQVEAMVLSIDPERERISLGIKQLAKDPFSGYIADNPKGSIVRGVVKEVDARGAVIDLGNGIEGQLRASELGRDRVEDARTVLKVGDEIEAKFTRRRSQDPYDFAVDQGQGGPRGGRGRAELPHRAGW